MVTSPEVQIKQNGQVKVGISFFPYKTGNINDYFVFGRELGRGHFGIVRECNCILSGRDFACKSIDKSKLKQRAYEQELRMEIEAMKELRSHPNVVQIYKEFEDEEMIHLVMEKCNGGDLFEYISKRRRLFEHQSASIFRQIVDAVLYCHSNGIMHRDLKPENILLCQTETSLTAKLSDFGLASRVFPGDKTSGVVGSIYYMAPEVLRRERYSFSADVWSLGIILYASLCGSLPFWGKTPNDTFEAICNAELNFNENRCGKISDSVKDLIRSMLTVDPNSRPTPREIIHHPWIELHFPKPNPPAIQNQNIYRSLSHVIATGNPPSVSNVFQPIPHDYPLTKAHDPSKVSKFSPHSNNPQSNAVKGLVLSQEEIAYITNITQLRKSKPIDVNLGVIPGRVDSIKEDCEKKASPKGHSPRSPFGFVKYCIKHKKPDMSSMKANS